MSDDFRNMMERHGVTPFGPHPDAPRPRREVKPMGPYPAPAPSPNPEEGPRWATGRSGLAQVEFALSRLSAATRSGKPGWIVAIRQDGKAVPITLAPVQMFAARLLSEATRLDARLMVIGGDGWTAVLHPGEGAATIATDPQGDA